ncbi:DUF3325 domain-containing protein [Luteimonas aquatica]|uniref:DUF3325 domain-containing protein n=1 Tax=Luteimonas aquatica TaxID=450364 RepID=UPI001F58E710|nr:DUF3325 domain-containing protein [Luteimonas aquatica]
MNPYWLCAGLSIAAWAAICLAQPRHYLATFGQEPMPARSRVLVLAGVLLQAAAFVLLVRRDGWEFGPVLWSVLLCLGALAWVLAHAANARRAPWLLLLAPACAVAAGLF